VGVDEPDIEPVFFRQRCGDLEAKSRSFSGRFDGDKSDVAH
jgi:hypothetical protein